MNAGGVVDAVISDDSDAFCYGAKVLLRNFSISSGNGACVEKFTIEKVEQSLKLDRNRLIFMAILLGCDFCPSGVPGVGKETVLQLFEGNLPKYLLSMYFSCHILILFFLEFNKRIIFSSWTHCQAALKVPYGSDFH